MMDKRSNAQPRGRRRSVHALGSVWQSLRRQLILRDKEMNAAGRVFGTFELLEMILLLLIHPYDFLAMKTILLSQRVNRTFCQTIQNSTILERNLRSWRKTVKDYIGIPDDLTDLSGLHDRNFSWNPLIITGHGIPLGGPACGLEFNWQSGELRVFATRDGVYSDQWVNLVFFYGTAWARQYSTNIVCLDEEGKRIDTFRWMLSARGPYALVRDSWYEIIEALKKRCPEYFDEPRLTLRSKVDSFGQDVQRQLSHRFRSQPESGPVIGPCRQTNCRFCKETKKVRPERLDFLVFNGRLLTDFMHHVVMNKIRPIWLRPGRSRARAVVFNTFKLVEMIMGCVAQPASRNGMRTLLLAQRTSRMFQQTIQKSSRLQNALWMSTPDFLGIDRRNTPTVELWPPYPVQNENYYSELNQLLVSLPPRLSKATRWPIGEFPLAIFPRQRPRYGRNFPLLKIWCSSSICHQEHGSWRKMLLSAGEYQCNDFIVTVYLEEEKSQLKFVEMKLTSLGWIQVSLGELVDWITVQLKEPTDVLPWRNAPALD